MDIRNANYRIEMDDGSKWDVAVSVIAENRAHYYSKEFEGDLQKSLDEDTWPFFDSDHYAIEDWAKNNMNWDDVKHDAIKISDATPDYDDSWVEGDVEIVEG